MNYNDTIDYLYSATPQFQRIGAAAYKPGLDTAIALDNAFGNPHRRYKTIHVAGTNGKGSTCHTLAAVLQAAGYKVGLYTSPHLVDFRERIRVNGRMIPRQAVTEFVESYLGKDLGLSPSFFELTTIMAFDRFAKEEVDIAVIETGLGGRLDTTNIITPITCAITNISLDHVAQLGNSPASIAFEKAGIMKPGVDVVIGNADDAEVKEVFLRRAREVGANPIFAKQDIPYSAAIPQKSPSGLVTGIIYRDTPFGDITGTLTGDCQKENTATIIHTLLSLRRQGIEISEEAVREGFANVAEMTGLMGRWAVVSRSPLIICDTGHNEGGWRYLSRQLSEIADKGSLTMIIGFVNDKDVNHILALMPRNAKYLFTRASVPRALDENVLTEKASSFGLKGHVCNSVAEALAEAKAESAPTDTIFVGGSTFIVADLMSILSA